MCIFQIVKIGERILGAQENPLRSLLSVNEKGIYRSATPKTPLICDSFRKTHQRVHIAEGFLCIFQIVKISERILDAQENPLRSLLSVNEKGIYRSATTKTPLIFAILLLRTPHPLPAKRHLRSAGARPEVHPAVRQPVRRCPAKQPAKQR